MLGILLKLGRASKTVLARTSAMGLTCSNTTVMKAIQVFTTLYYKNTDEYIKEVARDSMKMAVVQLDNFNPLRVKSNIGKGKSLVQTGVSITRIHRYMDIPVDSVSTDGNGKRLPTFAGITAESVKNVYAFNLSEGDLAVFMMVMQGSRACTTSSSQGRRLTDHQASCT